MLQNFAQNERRITKNKKLKTQLRKETWLREQRLGENTRKKKEWKVKEIEKKKELKAFNLPLIWLALNHRGMLGNQCGLIATLTGLQKTPKPTVSAAVPPPPPPSLPPSIRTILLR